MQYPGSSNSPKQTCPDSEHDSSSTSSYSFSDPVLERMRKKRINCMVDPLLNGSESQDNILNLNAKRGYLLKYSKHYRREQILDANEKESISQKSILEDYLKELPSQKHVSVSSEEPVMAQKNTWPLSKRKKSYLSTDTKNKRSRRVSFLESSDSESYYISHHHAQNNLKTKTLECSRDSYRSETVEMSQVREQHGYVSADSNSPLSSPDASQGADYFSLSTRDHNLNLTMANLNIDGDAVKRFKERKGRKKNPKNGIPQWLSNMFHVGKRIDEEKKRSQRREGG